MRKYFFGLAVLVTLGLGVNQLNAESPVLPKALPSVAPVTSLEGKLTVEQKKEKYAAKQAEWAALSKEQKLKILNDRQAQKIKSMQTRWAKLSDDQKITRYEGGMKRGQAMSLKSAEYRQKCDELMRKAKTNP